jgi:hypothetical protein
MTDYRRALDRESERFDLAPGALDRVLERGRRKDRNQRMGAGLVALVVVVIGSLVAISAFRGATNVQRPGASPTSSPGGRLYQQIAGTYTVTLSATDPEVAAQGMTGTYTLRLLPDGVLQLSAPPGSLREGPSPSGIAYRLSGSRFTTNAFVNISCPGSIGIGTYRWTRAGGRLVFTPLQEDCAIRRTLFSSKPWRLQPGSSP